MNINDKLLKNINNKINDINNKITQNTNNINDNTNNINDINNQTVLWTNSNPNTNFEEQTITLSESIYNFEFIVCVSKPYTKLEEIKTNILYTKEITEYFVYDSGPFIYESIGCLGWRNGRVQSGGIKLDIFVGTRIKGIGVAGQADAITDWFIPVKIIGINRIN